MKVSFEATEQEAKLLVSALQFAISQTNNNATKKKLSQIIGQIKKDHWLDSTIFGFVHNMLDNYTTSKIYKNSHLYNQLSLDNKWVQLYMHKGCNKIVLHLLKLSKSKKKPKNVVTPADTTKCVFVKDIMNLIQDSYESAE